MVATAIYSLSMVLWKETAFPLCRAMERRGKRNVVSLVSSVIVVIGPTPANLDRMSSLAISCHVPVLFFSRLRSEVGHTMDVLSPFILYVLSHSD